MLTVFFVTSTLITNCYLLFLELKKEGVQRLSSDKVEFLSENCVRVGFRKFCETPINKCDNSESLVFLVWQVTYYIVTSLSVLLFIVLLGKVYTYINKSFEERSKFSTKI